MSDIAYFFEDKELISLKVKSWETNFFNKKIGLLKILRPYNSLISDKQVLKGLEWLMLQEVCKSYKTIEVNLDIHNFRIISELENLGFRLVDSKVSFLTKGYKKDFLYSDIDFSEKRIDFASQTDMERVLKLTEKNLTDNDKFFSRYKYAPSFSKEECRNYYNAWIHNTLLHKDSLSAVTRNHLGEAIGYFVYKDFGRHKDLPLYKGIIAAVDPAYRGESLHLHMQSFLVEKFKSEPFYIDNTTQLTNFPVISNHIKSKRKLSRIVLTFFLNN